MLISSLWYSFHSVYLCHNIVLYALNHAMFLLVDYTSIKLEKIKT